MKKYIARFVMIFSLILGATFLFSSTTEAADYNVTKIDAKGVNNTYGSSDIRINKDGQLQYYTFFDSGKKDVFKKVIYNEKTTTSKKLFKRKMFGDYEVVKQNGDKTLWLVYQKNKNHYFVKYNDKGKVLTKIKTGKIKANYHFSICDIVEDGNKIYCVLKGYLPKKQKKYIDILCINKNKSKIISRKRISIKNSYLLEFANNKIYAMDGNNIDVYSLKGKNLATYQLPEGSTYKDKEYYVDAYTVKGGVIYYVNTRGLFKCDELETKAFEIIYDASNDDLFTKSEGTCKTVSELCVKNDNEFYLVFSNDAEFDTTAPTAIARYTKKK
ncbi:MAG: hypothetical protein E7267_01915 [Lachnospiraceae bacterium]|nr:hypothetical protein [Lachnospiraceae bacterium]